MPELDKTYTPTEVEARWYQQWLDDNAFTAHPARVSDKRPAYSVVIPPPNVTGILTLGHVLNNTIQDILCRRARMLGKEVLWLPGTDHAGIATQNVVEKNLKKQGAIKHRDDLGREKLVEKIWEWKEKHGGIIIQQLKKLGASCDWSRERFTMDEDYSRCVQRVFVDLYKKGLIYRGKRMVNWCPSSLTALSDEEVTMKPQNAVMYYFQVEVMEDAPCQAERIDTDADLPDDKSHERPPVDPRLQIPSYICRSHFSDGRRAHLAAANRRRMGQAEALCRKLVGDGSSEAGVPWAGIAAATAEIGLPLIDLATLGLSEDTDGVFQSGHGDLTRLNSGAEAQPFLAAQQGVVYKIIAGHRDGFGKALRVSFDQLTGTWHSEPTANMVLGMLAKLNLLHEIGGLPTELVGITSTADWIIKQPQCATINSDSFAAARAEAVARVGGVQIAEPSLADLRIVWHRDTAWFIGDLHAKNIMRDHQGRAVIIDALVCKVTSDMLANSAALKRAVDEAKTKATGASDSATLGLFAEQVPSQQRVLTIATTRPEVIPGDQAIAVNPKDPRYAHLIGKHARRPLPLEDQAALPIIGDEHVDFEFGTGVLKVTPAHDKADFEIAQRHGLPAVDVMHPNGVLNELAGKDLVGMERFAARKRAAELLAEIGSLVKEEPYQNNVGYSERADVPIESRLSEQWFLKYPSVEQARACVSQGSAGVSPVPLSDECTGETPALLSPMRFFPDRWAKVYDHWMGGLQDWCISRQLWWGHRVPVWSRKLQINKWKLHQQLQEWDDLDDLVFDDNPSGTLKIFRVKDGSELDLSSGEFAANELIEDDLDVVIYVSTTDEPHCQWLVTNCGFTQDPDVLDTWFSSWLWPFATMGWPEKTDTLSKFYPTTDLVTGPDIIFFWVARMIMAGYEYMGEMPFKNVYFTGIIRDKQGRKMSKSLGNSPDPLELIANYSADALRFGIMRSAPLGQDIAFDEKNVELGRNFCTKLWNAARFRQMQSRTGILPETSPKGILPENHSAGDGQDDRHTHRPEACATEAEINPALLSSDDKWIILRLNTAINEVTTALEEYRFSDATNTLYRFFWSEYCDWYVEASKAALRPVEMLKSLSVEHASAPDTESTIQQFNSSTAQRNNTLAVMDFVLGQTLRLFHPFMPFITEELWHGMGFNADMPENQGGKSIMFAPWPKPLDADELAHFGILPEDEKIANDKYETVNLGRTLKSAFNINKKVRFVLKPAQELPEHEVEVLRILLNAEPLDVEANFVAKKGTPTVLTPLGELFLPLDGIIDVDAERVRVTKEVTKVESELAKVRAKLADESFTSKVPQKVLDDHTQREADWSAQLAKLKTMLEALG